MLSETAASPCSAEHLLKNARLQRGWTQQHLAEALGVEPNTVSRWERGLTLPTSHHRAMLSHLFGLDFEGPNLWPESLPTPSSQNGKVIDPLIPLEPTFLVGHDALLASLKRRLCRGRAVVALGGLPGVGKTTLATALVHDPQIRAHFHHGLLWAGPGPSPNLPALLRRWGELLGIEEEDLAALDSREDWARALRIAIGDRRMLLVIDDAWKLEDVFALTGGGPNCAFLVTTRFRDLAAYLTVEDAIELPELSEEDGLALLRSLAPGFVEQEAAKTRLLVQAVGGLPLALTLMGNHLRQQASSRQPRRIAEAVERLLDAETRLQVSAPHPPAARHPSLPLSKPLSLQAIIALSERRLSPQARTALYALAVFPAKPATFSEEAAMAVTGYPVEVLGTLVDAGLVESVGEGRYCFHPTIADYARQHLTGTAAQQRLIASVRELVQTQITNHQVLAQEYEIILAALEMAEALNLRAEGIAIVNASVPFLLANVTATPGQMGDGHRGAGARTQTRACSMTPVVKCWLERALVVAASMRHQRGRSTDSFPHVWTVGKLTG